MCQATPSSASQPPSHLSLPSSSPGFSVTFPIRGGRDPQTQLLPQDLQEKTQGMEPPSSLTHQARTRPGEEPLPTWRIFVTTGPADAGRGSCHYLNVLQEKPKARLGLQFPTSHLKWEPSVKGWSAASLPLCDYCAVKAAPLPVDAANLGSRVRAEESSLQTGSSRWGFPPGPGIPV